MIWSYLDNLDQDDHPQQGLCLFFEHIKDQECTVIHSSYKSESMTKMTKRMDEKPHQTDMLKYDDYNYVITTMMIITMMTMMMMEKSMDEKQSLAPSD